MAIPYERREAVRATVALPQLVEPAKLIVSTNDATFIANFAVFILAWMAA